MKHAGKIFLLALILLCSAAQTAWSAPQPPDQPRRKTPAKQHVLVGRISFIEGELLRYIHEAKDWVVTVKDTPFGREDALYSGENGKAEFLMPNSTWIRIGPNTQIQMIALAKDATEVDVAAGMARFIDRSSKAVMKATTPFGYAVGAPGSVFDVYVGDESVEVIAIKGKVDFIHDLDGAKYHVIPGSISILADNRQASAGPGKVDAEWDKWNITRDSVLTHSIQTRGQSVDHLPEGIREDSGVLDANGRWERVYYEGEYRDVWRPTSVERGWAPYTVGHWTDWYGDYTWVPYEPFGYVTHHYGFWFFTNDTWYWAPPVVSIGWDFPHWGIGFEWYPGRVGWLYSGTDVGWFPLLPWEPFYAFSWWGPRGFAVYNAGLINLNVNRYAHWNRAVFVNQSNFHNVNSYSQTRLTNLSNSSIASQFKAAPVLSNNLLRNAGDPQQRFNYTNAVANSKPAQNVTSRVAQNQAKFTHIASAASGAAIRNQVAGAKLATPAHGASFVSPGGSRHGTSSSLSQGGSRHGAPSSLSSGAMGQAQHRAGISRSSHGFTNLQNPGLRQGRTQPKSRNAFSRAPEPAGARMGRSPRMGGPMGQRPGSQRSRSGARGPGGRGIAAPRGGGGHGGSRR
jgi:hypothetical protein